jgi:hypothetical protein
MPPKLKYTAPTTQFPQSKNLKCPKELTLNKNPSKDLPPSDLIHLLKPRKISKQFKF